MGIASTLSDIKHFELLKDITLNNINQHRLIEHIMTYPRLNELHYHSHFILYRVLQISIVLCSLGYSVDDDVLYAIEYHDSLFSLDFIRDHSATELNQKRAWMSFYV